MSEQSSTGLGETNQPYCWRNDRHNHPLFTGVWNTQSWSPPEDPDKPSFPYIPGLTLELDRHIPRPPQFVENLRKTLQPLPFLPRDYLRSVPQSKVVIDNPPLETDPPTLPETARLVVTAPIVAGALRGAQVLSCTIHPQADSGDTQLKPFQAVAKIYDPLYYNFEIELGGEPQDVVHWANHHYSNESAAYEQLLKAGHTGLSAPLYYGSWTFRLPIISNGKSCTRSVRLILIEQLNGKTFRDTRIRNNPNIQMGLDSFHYPEEYRLEILAQAMDGFVRQLRSGVNQFDFAGRNVVLVSDSNSSATSGGLTLPRVVLIDYNNATVDVASPKQCPLSLPENPVSTFWKACLWEEFGGWVPHEWEDGKAQRRWLLRRFNGDDRRQLYQPISEPSDQ